MKKQRIEHLDIAVDENAIDMIDAFANKESGFTVEAYWDEFCDIMLSLHSALERRRDNTLILTCRCVPCDFTFRAPIPVLISENPFDSISCPQCGNETPNVVKSINYREWEKENGNAKE